MAEEADRLGRPAILGLVAMALAVLVVANDFTALSVALPAVEKQFGVGVNKVQWVINGYALVFGVGLFYSSITTAAVTVGRSVALEPRRRDRLHVPGRRPLAAASPPCAHA